jgi:hypothetical protein
MRGCRSNSCCRLDRRWIATRLRLKLGLGLGGNGCFALPVLLIAFLLLAALPAADCHACTRECEHDRTGTTRKRDRLVQLGSWTGGASGADATSAGFIDSSGDESGPIGGSIVGLGVVGAGSASGPAARSEVRVVFTAGFLAIGFGAVVVSVGGAKASVDSVASAASASAAGASGSVVDTGAAASGAGAGAGAGISATG